MEPIITGRLTEARSYRPAKRVITAIDVDERIAEIMEVHWTGKESIELVDTKMNMDG